MNNTEYLELLEVLASDLEDDRFEKYNKKVRGLRLNISLCDDEVGENEYLLNEKAELRKKFKKFKGALAVALDNYNIEVIPPSQNIFFSRDAMNKYFIEDYINMEDEAIKKYLKDKNYHLLKKSLNIIEKYTKGIALLEYNDLLDFQLKKKKTPIKTSSDLNWVGGQTELIELIKSLIENGSIKGVQKEIIRSFGNFLNIKINNPDKLIQDIKTRNNGSETLFIDKLKSSLLGFIKKENKR